MERNYFLYLAVFFTAAITIGSLISMKDVIEIKVDFFDKILHVGAYLVLALSWLLSFNYNKPFKTPILIAIIVFVYGIIIEVLQVTLTNNRQADFYDILANLGGITVALLLFTFVLQKKQMN